MKNGTILKIDVKAKTIKDSNGKTITSPHVGMFGPGLHQILEKW